MALWKALEVFEFPSAPLIEWRLHLGTDADTIANYLRPSAQRVATCPCVHPAPCGCRHELVPLDDDRFAAICRCPGSACPTFQVTAADGLVYDLDVAGLAVAIGRSLGFAPVAPNAITGTRCSFAAGALPSAGHPAVLTVAGMPPSFLRDFATLRSVLPGPFVQLTPTASILSAESLGQMQQHSALHIPLDRHVATKAGGGFEVRDTADALIRRFTGSAVRMMPHPQVSAAISARRPPERFVFRRSGQVWRVVFAGGPEFHLADTLGARYLDHLLHHAGETIAARDLEVAVTPEKAASRSGTSIQLATDPEAKRSYLRELTRLRADRDEARDQGRHVEADEIEAEIGPLEAALNKGKIATDTGERARGNVSKAIKAVERSLLKGERHERAFGEHLKEYVSKGYSFRYAHPTGGVWH